MLAVFLVDFGIALGLFALAGIVRPIAGWASFVTLKPLKEKK